MEKQIHQLNSLGVPEAPDNFFMVVRMELRTTDGTALRLIHNKPLIHWPSRVVHTSLEEAQAVALKLARQAPGFRYAVVSPCGNPTVVEDENEDLL